MRFVVEDVYRSANGDRWALLQDGATQAFVVRHTANAASGGMIQDTDMDAFLAVGGGSPECAAIRHHLATAMPEPAHAIVAGVQRAWQTAFARRDAEALAALYAPQTTFYGSTNALHTDPAGVRRYFAGLSQNFLGSSFAPPHILWLGADAFVAAGPVLFTTTTGEHPYRMTWVLARQDGGGWLIATHHASPEPGPG